MLADAASGVSCSRTFVEQLRDALQTANEMTDGINVELKAFLKATLGIFLRVETWSAAIPFVNTLKEAVCSIT